MRFLAPAFLAGAALVALPIVLHLLRRDVAARVPFTAVRLLRSTPLDRSRNRRLRDLLLLVARVAAVLLLAASFARPYRPGVNGTGTLTIVAVDRSFSMGAGETFQRALALAGREIDAAGTGRVALLAFDDRADVVAPPGFAADARAALSTLSPGFGGTRYATLFERAAELAGSDGATRLDLISDLQRAGFDGAEAALPAAIDLQIRDAGAAHPNLAIDGIDVSDGRARVNVRNYGAARAETTLRLEQPSRAAITRRVAVEGQSSVAVWIDGVAAGATKASIDDARGYAADNTRFAVSQGGELPRVLVISGGPGSPDGFYFTRALQAAGESGSDFDVRPMTGADFAKIEPAEVAKAAAVVLLSTHAIQRHAAESFAALFAAGGGVFVAAGPDVDPSMLSELLELKPALSADERVRKGVLAVSDLRHPIFRSFDALSANLSHVAFERAWEMAAPSWTTVASFSSGTPALLEQVIGNGRVLLFASDVDRRWNDFPLHGTFVPFVQEALHYVAARRVSNEPLLVSDVPDGVPARPGIAAMRGRLRPVNVDTRESDVERVSPAEFVRAVTRPASSRPAAGDRPAREREAAQGWWRYGLGLMLITLVLEAFVGAR